MDYAKESLRLHAEWKGKIEVTTRVPVETKDDLSLAYTPGVAQPCLEIQKDINKSYELTRRWNLCAVVTDGTAVLGLGDIGPEAGMPVMEGKCVLFKAFGGVDAFPLCVKSKDVDEIVNTVYMISGSFGGVNLEDISAPRCFEIERKLKEKCARHGGHYAGRSDERFEGRRQEEGGREDRDLRRWRGGHFDRQAAAFRGLSEHHDVRPQGRDLQGKRRPELDQRRDGGGHEP